MINTDKIAAMCHIMDIEGEIERLRGCWKRANEAKDAEAMAFFVRAANGLKAEVSHAKQSAKSL